MESPPTQTVTGSDLLATQTLGGGVVGVGLAGGRVGCLPPPVAPAKPPPPRRTTTAAIAITAITTTTTSSEKAPPAPAAAAPAAVGARRVLGVVAVLHDSGTSQ